MKADKLLLDEFTTQVNSDLCPTCKNAHAPYRSAADCVGSKYIQGCQCTECGTKYFWTYPDDGRAPYAVEVVYPK